VVVIVAARANERRSVTTIVFYPIVQVILRCGKINVLYPLAVDIVNPPPQWARGASGSTICAILTA
jgi:hypothetical protein